MVRLEGGQSHLTGWGTGNLEQMPGASTLLVTAWGPVYTVTLRRAAIRPATCIAGQSELCPDLREGSRP